MTAKVINDPSLLGWDYDATTGRWTWGGSGGIPEAPVDGTQYGRQDAGWSPIVGGGSGGNDSRISDTQITNWDDAYSWGDHDAVDYMRWSSFSETDPTVPNHVKDITQTDIANWNAATGGGGGAGPDPRISDTQISNWDTSFSWGDHKSESYLKVEADPVFKASPAFTITQTMIDDWNDATGSGSGGSGGDDPRITDQQIVQWDDAYSWGNHELKNYATEVWVTGKNYATQAWVNGKSYATETWVTNKSYATTTWVTSQSYATQSWVSSNYQPKGSYETAGTAYTKAQSDAKYELKGAGGGGHNGVDPIQIAAKGLGLCSNQAGSSFKTLPIIEMQSAGGLHGGLGDHSGYRLSVKMTGGWGDQQFFFHCASTWGAYNATPALTIANSGCTAADFIATSDERLKDNVVTAPTGVIESITGREWDWAKSGNKGSGVVAQELEKVLPHLVHEDADGMKSVSYNGLVAYLIEEVKALKSEVEELKRSGR